MREVENWMVRARLRDGAACGCVRNAKGYDFLAEAVVKSVLGVWSCSADQ